MKMKIRGAALVAALVIAGGGAGVNVLANGAAAPADLDGPEQDISQKGLHLVLNVAGNRLHVYEDGKRTDSYHVSVGMRGHETPQGDYRIRDVIWNPWWHPPNSEWARGRKPEAPGPSNPMGRVKLNFAPLLYIHGTVDWQALGEPASHGCVRMRNADLIELTKLVHRHASPNVKAETIRQLERSPTMTRTIRLKTPVRFTARYDVATVDDGFLIIYPDHYGLVRRSVRDQAIAALREHGVDARRLDTRQLDDLVEQSTKRRVVIAVDELVRGGTRNGEPES